MRHQRLHKKLKLSHHKHTGRRLPRSETSHGVLLVILLLTGGLLLASKELVLAVPPDQSGQVQVAGIVKGPAPDRAAGSPYNRDKPGSAAGLPKARK